VGWVRPEGMVPAQIHPSQIGDCDEDGMSDLTLEFDRQALTEYLGRGTSEMAL
jgi:hypothetical protein